MSRAGSGCLAPAFNELEPLKGSSLYAAARRRVAGVFNMQGQDVALAVAKGIREAYEDMALSHRVA